MLPKELPKLPHLDISVYMKTATEVGGDYYDFNVDDNGSLTFIVGDATGHGMMSGMMVSIMKSFFISNQKKIELKEFFESTGDSIKDMHLGRLMMPLIGVQITSEKLIATNAGMPSLVYFRQKSQKAGEFVSNNMPLGAMKGIKYSLKEIRYEKGDTLLLMSDGFAELKNENGEQYGYERVKEDFRSVAQKSPNEVINHLKTSASNWTKEVEPDDDVTFVVIKVK
jgi:serine phosphatase RsbU (regulator of sigma subunit)